MPILTIRHVTTYHYQQPVAFGEHRMMLRPRDDGDQKVLEIRARNHARAEPTCLDAGYLRQSCRDRPFRGRGPASFASKAPFSSTTRRSASAPPISRTLPVPIRLPTRRKTGQVSPASSRRDPRTPARSLGRRASCARTDRPTLTRCSSDMTQTIKRTFRHKARHQKGTQDPVRDAEARERELPRCCGAHDRGAALAWLRRAVRVRISASCR